MTREQSLHLETERFIMRPLGPSDCGQLHELWTTAEVRRYLWDGETIPWERTLAILQKNDRMFQELSAGLWGGFRAGAADLVGFAGFWHFREPPELELLYGVAGNEWGKDCATELATRVIRYAFETLRFPSIRASTDVANAASSRVLDKLGFKLTRREAVGGLDTLFYELKAPARVEGSDHGA